jgi:hypothetical protein
LPVQPPATSRHPLAFPLLAAFVHSPLIIFTTNSTHAASFSTTAKPGSHSWFATYSGQTRSFSMKRDALSPQRPACPALTCSCPAPTPTRRAAFRYRLRSRGFGW